MIVAMNAFLLVIPWHVNIKPGDRVPEYTPYLQGTAVAFIIIFTIEVGLLLLE